MKYLLALLLITVLAFLSYNSGTTHYSYPTESAMKYKVLTPHGWVKPKNLPKVDGKLLVLSDDLEKIIWV